MWRYLGGGGLVFKTQAGANGTNSLCEYIFSKLAICSILYDLCKKTHHTIKTALFYDRRQSAHFLSLDLFHEDMKD